MRIISLISLIGTPATVGIAFCSSFLMSDTFFPILTVHLEGTVDCVVFMLAEILASGVALA